MPFNGSESGNNYAQIRDSNGALKRLAANGSIWRKCWDISGVTQGFDNNNRVGFKINVKRISVRFIIWYSQTPVIALFDGSGRTQGAFRCFCYVNKVEKYKTDPPFGWPSAGKDLGTNTSSAFSFNNATSFLQTDRIASFYNLSTVQNFEILGDSGVVFMNPAKKCRKQIMHAPVNGVPEAFDHIFQTPTPGGCRYLTAIVSENDFEGDEIRTNINLNATLDGAVELAAGTGGPFESVYTSFLSNLSTNSVRADSQVISQYNGGATNDQVNRVEIWNPSAEPELIEWNFDVDIPVEFDNLGLYYPLHNGIRFGLMYCGGPLNAYIDLQTRIIFEDS